MFFDLLEIEIKILSMSLTRLNERGEKIWVGVIPNFKQKKK